MITKIAIKPSIPAVSLADVKVHLRIEAGDTDYDARLTPYLQMAVDIAQDQTGRALITQTWDIIFSSWAGMATAFLPFGELQSVTSLKYFDSDGAEQTVGSEGYKVAGIGTDEGRIIYPSAPALRSYNPIVARIVCGYGDATTDIPSSIQAAIKLMVSDIEDGDDSTRSINVLLNSYRLWRL